MKHFYLILIAFFILLSCSKDDASEENNQENSNSTTYTLEVTSPDELAEIKVYFSNNSSTSSQEITRTETFNNTDSLSVDFRKEEGSVLTIEINGESTPPIIRYKIYGKCNNEVVSLILDKSDIATSISEFTSQLTTYNCENF